MKTTLATAESQVMSVDAYLNNTTQHVLDLCNGPITPAALSEIEDAIVEMAPRNPGHHGPAIAATIIALEIITRHDPAQAVRAVESVIEVSAPNTPLETQLVHAWSGLMMSHSEEGRVSVFNQASTTFAATTKPALKAEAAAKVAALSVDAVKPEGADLHGIKRVLDLVANFARSHNDSALLGLASSHMTHVNNRIRFSGPEYQQR